jgi:hypothetical protein
MKSKRPYLVLHRRMEKDVWVRRGVVVYLAWDSSLMRLWRMRGYDSRSSWQED